MFKSVLCAYACYAMVFYVISQNRSVLTGSQGAKDLVNPFHWFWLSASLQMAVQLCRNGLSDWAGSDTMQTISDWAGSESMHCYVVGWHINHAHISDLCLCL